MMEMPWKFHLHGGGTAGSLRTVRAGAPQISPVCEDMSLYLVGKHCAPAVEREHEAVGEAVCGPAGGGRSVGEDSVGEDSVGGRSVGGNSVGGNCAVEVAAAAVGVGGVGAGASVGSLTVVGASQADMTDYGRCSPDLGR